MVQKTCSGGNGVDEVVMVTVVQLYWRKRWREEGVEDVEKE